MFEDKSKKEIFEDRLGQYVEDFGLENQDGVRSALRECQEIFGEVSKQDQEDIAQAFGLENKMMSTIIRFMPSIKESKVEYEFVCCTGSRCAKNGSIDVLKAAREYLDLDFDEVSSDGRIRLSSKNCFKQCGKGPNIRLNDKFYHQMDRKKVKELVDSLKLKD